MAETRVLEVAAGELADVADSDKRCSDWENECEHVKEPLTCWLGGERCVAGEIHVLPIADGYCPLLRRQVQRS